MRRSSLLRIAAASAALVACDDDSSTSSDGGRIDPALIGSWAKQGASMFSDTLVFTEAKYQVPYCSGVGQSFWAQDGIVSHSSNKDVCGEYLIAKDTLYYESLLGETPDGVDKSTAGVYFRIP